MTAGDGGDRPPVRRLRLARLARQLSQDQLAEAAGVTRQAVAGLEAGRFDPSLPVALRLARALGSSVEALFGGDPRPAVVATRWASTPADRGPVGRRPGPEAAVGTRVATAAVDGRWWAFPLYGSASSSVGFGAATGVVGGPGVDDAADAGEPASVPVRSLRPPVPTVVVAGCDPALPLLAEPLGRLDPPVGLLWWPCSTGRALALAAAGAVHVAGVHRAASGPPRREPDTTGAVLGTDAVAVGFAAWDEGLAVSPALADRVRSVADLARLQVPIVNREPGAEARRLLQRECRRHGVRPTALAGWDVTLPGHLPVAAAVAAGLAGAGITTGPAALAHGVPFVPLVAEHSRLVVPRRHLATPEVRGLLAVLGGAELRDQLGALAGYDPSDCGRVL